MPSFCSWSMRRSTCFSLLLSTPAWSVTWPETPNGCIGEAGPPSRGAGRPQAENDREPAHGWTSEGSVGASSMSHSTHEREGAPLRVPGAVPWVGLRDRRPAVPEGEPVPQPILHRRPAARGRSGGAGDWAVGNPADGNGTSPSPGRCRHQLADLSEGTVDAEGCLVCPWHQSRYDVRTGEMVVRPARLPRVPRAHALARPVWWGAPAGIARLRVRLRHPGPATDVVLE